MEGCHSSAYSTRFSTSLLKPFPHSSPVWSLIPQQPFIPSTIHRQDQPPPCLCHWRGCFSLFQSRPLSFRKAMQTQMVSIETGAGLVKCIQLGVSIPVWLVVQINHCDFLSHLYDDRSSQGKLYLCLPPALLWWRRQWHLTPVLLPGKSHGWRSLVGCSPWGHQESDTTEQLHFHFSLSCIGEGNGNPLQCSCLENPRDGGAWWAAVYGVT